MHLLFLWYCTIACQNTNPLVCKGSDVWDRKTRFTLISKNESLCSSWLWVMYNKLLIVVKKSVKEAWRMFHCLTYMLTSHSHFILSCVNKKKTAFKKKMAFYKRCHFNCRHLKAKVWFSALRAWDHVLSETFSLCESGKPISSAGQKPPRWQWLVTVYFSFCIMWPCCGLWAAFFPPLIFARLPVHHMNTASHSKLVFPERIHCVLENT